MSTTRIASTVAAIAGRADLHDDRAFALRGEALDELERAADELDARLDAAPAHPALRPLREAVALLQSRLEAADDELFARLRAAVRNGLRGPQLAQLLSAIAPPAARLPAAKPGFDALDRLVNGLLGAAPPPAETVAREPEMVFYQKTPARVLLQLLQRAQLAAGDTLYDLGAGLGQLPLLVALLSKARAVGVEIEPAYVAYARARAAELSIDRARFVAADARHADLTPATHVFMYTPFSGAILASVLARLEQRAQQRPLRVYSYGPCTSIVAQQPWLRPEQPGDSAPYSLAAFASR